MEKPIEYFSNLITTFEKQLTLDNSSILESVRSDVVQLKFPDNREFMLKNTTSLFSYDIKRIHNNFQLQIAQKHNYNVTHIKDLYAICNTFINRPELMALRYNNIPDHSYVPINGSDTEWQKYLLDRTFYLMAGDNYALLSILGIFKYEFISHEKYKDLELEAPDPNAFVNDKIFTTSILQYLEQDFDTEPVAAAAAEEEDFDDDFEDAEAMVVDDEFGADGARVRSEVQREKQRDKQTN